MRLFIPATCKGVSVISIMAFSTLMHFVPLILIAMIKLLVPWRPVRVASTRLLIAISFNWIRVNNGCFSLFHKTRWEIEGGGDLSQGGWYLVLCNHQSWVDILVLQKIFSGKIPFLKFFLKQQLIWVPVMGLAWWALDFPFMKRYRKEYLLKHPHKKGKDLESTRKACEKFVTTPVSVMNFVEGTRITEAKHQRQQSPFQGLLRPKAAGAAFVLAAMGEQMNRIVDVTLAYPHGIPTFWQFICGRTSLIRIHIRTLPIGKELRGDYFNDASFRKFFQEYLNTLWAEKEKRLTAMQSPQEGKSSEKSREAA